MSTLTVLAQVKPEKRQEFLQTPSSLYSTREEEKGLKKFTRYLITEWETQKDLERHGHAEKFRVLPGALEVRFTESEFRYRPKTENVPDLSETQPLLPESSWRESLAVRQEEGRGIRKEKKEK